ncbi:hypothetical protein C6569_18880 [Phreatobacter cathodiphilus]|uniref:Uncharacterized protein n=1 Tax=Phreatobacter cathodiphilus TaxID=1868589 RepID=A0A2S0NFL5_9HYPH|nr:hypothetical protein C6569_18880 [Phreatobacter cathodiphilus]
MKALNEPDIVFHRVIFCGSIVPDDFRIAPFRAQLGPSPILNDCGTHDVLPVLAKSVTWGYGASGTFGFGTAGIHDRFSKFSHSSYFSRDFVEEYWLPFIAGGEIRETEWEKVRRTPPYWQSLLSALPLKWLPIIGLAAAVVSPLWGLRSRMEVSQKVYVGQWVGVTNIFARIHMINDSLSERHFSVAGARVDLPSGRQETLLLEGIAQCNGSVPQTQIITVAPASRVSCDYSFVFPSNTLPGLLFDINNYLMANAANVQNAFPVRTLFSAEMMSKIRSSAQADFSAEPGIWQMSITYLLSGEEHNLKVRLEVSEADVRRLKAQIDYAHTGLGVLQHWKYMAPDGSQAFREVKAVPVEAP